jgi:hypothetical protein
MSEFAQLVRKSVKKTADFSSIPQIRCGKVGGSRNNGQHYRGERTAD